MVSSSTSKSETSGGLSKSSSASSLKISDVSHLPVNANLVTYTVTEMLPTGSGEKITVYGDGGATSTEYRHFVNQDTAAASSSHIQQLSSTLNESTSNLSCASGSTYTVTEPRDEFKLTYNKNDSGWNGKFIVEEPTKPKGAIVEQSSTSTSHQESSSIAKSSSSSYVIEIVDGKERIVDQKHHESAKAQSSSNDEHLASRSGTNITPEVHYKQKAKESATSYDTAVSPQPKGYTSEAQREVHQIGDNISSSQSKTHDKYDSKHSLTDKTKDFLNSEQIDTNVKTNQISTDKSQSSNIKKQSSSSTQNVETAKNLGQTETVTTTVTYYDSKGNVIKEHTDVDTHAIPGSLSTQNIVSSSSNTKDISDHSIYSHKVSDSKVILDNTNIPGSTIGKISSTDNISDHSKRTTYYVDENYVDTNKIRASQTATDSKNFFGHSVDSRDIAVSNVYDSKAVQNTIGTKGRVILDHTVDSKDVVYSNDRNYGKTGWNGEFTYEASRQPNKEKKSQSPTRKPDKSKRVEEPPSRKGPSDTSTPIKPNKPQKTTAFDESTTTTSYVDENYVDTSKIRQSQTSTDSKNFYGHSVDSKNVFVDNVYDSKATQNTIGTSGRIFTDHTVTDSADIIYSNDRLYGKTGWNGHFVYEQPQQPKKPDDRKSSPSRKLPQKGPRTDESPSRRSPGEKKPSTSRKSPVRKGPQSSTDFLSTEIQENINQFTDFTDSKTNVLKDSKTNKFTDETYIIVDGQRVPKDKIVPTGPISSDSKTVVETIESVSNFSDSKTSLTKDSQTFEDRQQSTEHYTTHDTWDSSKPNGPKEPKKPVEKVPKDKIVPTGPTSSDSKTVVETFESVSKFSDSKTSVTKDSQAFEDRQQYTEHYTTHDTWDSSKPKGSKEPKQPVEKGPKDKIVPTGSIISDSKTVVETFESVSKFSDSKTSVTKDSQTFKDHQQLTEHYTTHDIKGPKQPVDSIKRFIDDNSKPKGPKQPRDSTKRTTDLVVDDTTTVTEDIQFKTSTTTDKLSTTDTKIIKDVVDRVDKTLVQENIVDIKDIVSR